MAKINYETAEERSEDISEDDNNGIAVDKMKKNCTEHKKFMDSMSGKDDFNRVKESEIEYMLFDA